MDSGKYIESGQHLLSYNKCFEFWLLYGEHDCKIVSDGSTIWNADVLGGRYLTNKYLKSLYFLDI